jgi:hypothetical protein
VQPIIKKVEQKSVLSKVIAESDPVAPLTESINSSVKIQQKTPRKRYTNTQRLSRLRDRINQKMINQEIYNYAKPNTGSVMHGTPSYVPHSFVEDSKTKAIASTASQVGNGFSITKDDNGTCTLTEDLSTMGLQGKTTSSFGCGLSKDEKAFKDHMKKVLKKLGK